MELKKGLIRPLAARFFAGETLDDGVSRVREVNASGMGATLDFLGEDVAEPSEARAAEREYERILAEVTQNALDCSLALKLTHLGLEADRGLAFTSLRALGGLARESGVRLWLDMEGSEHTDEVIEAYRMLAGTKTDCGIALQSSLWRTWDDLRALAAEGAMIRLVKGAYKEPPSVAAQRPSEIRGRFIEMLDYLSEVSPAFAIGTHDKKIIERAQGIVKTAGAGLEFQMLMGMRDRLKRALVESGHLVIEYVPYGTDWYGYGMRRLAEQKRNLLRFAEALTGG